MKENYEELEMSELRERWEDSHTLGRYEGTVGVTNLEKFLATIGYSQGNYVGYNNELINFLSDNPGAIEAILNFIDESNVPEWKESIIEELPEPEEIED
jgi:hypothetical protein